MCGSRSRRGWLAGGAGGAAAPGRRFGGGGWRSASCGRDAVALSAAWVDLGFGGHRLAPLGAVAVDRQGLEAELPAFQVGAADVFDVASLGTLQVLEIAPERNGCTAAIICRWPRKWMLRPPCGGANAQSKTGRCSSLQPGRPFDRVVRVDVVEDAADRRLVVAQLPQGHRHGPVDDLEHAAAGQLLVLDQGDVGLDAGRVAVHHEGDRAGRGQHGDLAVAIAVLAAHARGIRPRPRAASASRSAGADGSIASAASRCISMTLSIGSRLSGKPVERARRAPACSALVR